MSKASRARAARPTKAELDLRFGPAGAQRNSESSRACGHDHHAQPVPNRAERRAAARKAAR